MVESGGIGNFGTGCRKHHTLPLVTERLRCSFWSVERGEEPGVSPTEVARAVSGGTVSERLRRSFGVWNAARSVVSPP